MEFKILLYILVIIAAPTLEVPWMIATQAALGGLMIGTRIERFRMTWR